jgi:integrating conjugative element protein (TIGR03759 family)
MKRTKFFLTLMSYAYLGIMSASYAKASSMESNSVISTQEQTSQVKNTLIGSAQDWGLSDAEWQSYQKLMAGPAGKWYPQLTPSEVLGMFADNEQDEKHFAELAAKEEHDKIARELSFNNAFHEAMLRLYSNEPVIRDFDISAFNPIKGKLLPHGSNAVTFSSGDHLVIFVDTTPGMDFMAIPTLLGILNSHPGVYLDIYCTGNATDNDIQFWAKMNNIPVELVQKGIITLNHDNGKLKSIFGSGSLPQVMLVHNGQTQNVDLAILR